MNKNVLALSIITALSGLALTACGGSDGDSNNNSDQGGTGSKPALTAVFIDSPVEGLNYTCASYEAITDKAGTFSFNDGDTCTFKLGSIELGKTVAKKGQTMVTPYTIAKEGDKDHAIRIAALLQTMDDDGKPENGITLKAEDVAKLPNTINFDKDVDFNTSLKEALKQAQLNKIVVDTTTAADHLNATLAKANGKSVAVDKVLRDLVLQSKNWQETNFEEKLKEYKGILNAENSDEGVADRNIMQAIITLMEITNDPIVSKRFDIQPSSVVGQSYTTSLAKVLDIIVNPADMLAFNIKEQPNNTADIATLMGKYAAELEVVSNNLANIIDPDYSAKYGDSDELTLSFAQVQELRASTLAMASAMNVLSAYQYGSPSQFKVTQEKIIFNNFSTTYSSATGNNREIIFGTETVDAEYLNFNIRPAKLLKDENFFKFNQNYGALLEKAKKQLQQSIQLTLTTALPESNSDLNREMLKDLQKHLAGEKVTVELSDYVLIDDKGEWLGQYVEAKYTVDLNRYFSSGIDRDAVNIGVTEYCKYRGETIGEYDVNLSKALDTAMCSVTESEVKSIYQQIDTDHSYHPFYSFGYASTSWDPDTQTTYWTYNYAQGIPMRWFADISAKQGGNFNKVFVSCKARLSSPDQEWKEKPCDWLLSNSLSE